MSLKLLNVDDLDVDVSDTNPGLSHSPDKTAFVLYTSGSTGQPKGIVQSHRTRLHNLMTFTNALHLCKDDRISLLKSCSAAGGIRDIFLPYSSAQLFTRLILGRRDPLISAAG
jgi:acyl-coenzyme A synthetase/AMP-(fatty) acid ligase